MQNSALPVTVTLMHATLNDVLTDEGMLKATRSFETRVVQTAHLNHHLLLSSLLAERAAAHGENGLEALAALDGVLLELRDAGLLDCVLDLLPASANSRDLRFLVELCLLIRYRSIDNSLLDADDVGECEVCRAHGDLLCLWVDVGSLEDVRGLVTSEHGQEPFWCLLVAGDESFGAENSSRWIHRARQSVNRDDVGGLVVPWAVLSPVCCGDLLPGVVEVAGVGEDLHGRSGCRKQRLFACFISQEEPGKVLFSLVGCHNQVV